MNIQQALEHKFNNFDIIRLLAAILVIVSHSYDLLIQPIREPLRIFTGKEITIGSICVAVFFVISGFLIAKSAAESADITQFIKKRVLRVFPAFITVIIFSFAIIGFWLSHLSFKEYFLNQGSLNYLNNLLLYPINYTIPGVLISNPYPSAINGSIWTIPIEFTMYLLMIPITWIFIKRFSKYSLLLIIGILYYILNKIIYRPDLSQLHILMLPEMKFVIPLTLIFMIGAALYHFRDKIILHPILFIISVFAGIYSIQAQQFDKNYMLILAPALTYAVIFLSLYFKTTLYNAKKLGDYSYGIYLWGFVAQQVLIYKFHIDSVKTLAFTAIIVAFFCAFLSWKYIEKPALLHK